MAQLVGVVLAGGEGRRMGRDKASLVLAGQSLAERAASVLWPFCASVLVSVRPGVPSPVSRCPAVEDADASGRGPLAGISAAFAATGAADLLVLACDYPRVDDSLIRGMLEQASDTADLSLLMDATGRDHPLVALWRRSAQGAVGEALAERQYRVSTLLGDLNVQRLGVDAFPAIDLKRSLINLNWPSDLDALGS